MKNILNEFECKNTICTLCESYLNEEYCVATEIKNLCENVIGKINNGISHNQEQPINFDGITFKSGYFTENFMNKNLNIKWYYFNYFYPKSYDIFSRRINRIYKNSQYGNCISIVVEMTDGKIIDKPLEEVVYHEVMHFYQQEIKRGKDFVFDRTLYDMSIKNINSKDNLIRQASNVIYLSYKFEQDAKLQGLYALLMKSDSKENMWKIFKESDIYDDMMLLKGFIKNMDEYYINGNDENRKKLDEYLMKCMGIQYKSLISKAKKSIDRLEIKNGKVWLKAQNDIAKKGLKNELIEPVRQHDNIKDLGEFYDKVLKISTEKFLIENIRKDIRGFDTPLHYV